MVSLEHSTLFLPWLRVRLLQSFFFPSFKNLVDEHFPIQELINQLVSTVDTTMFNIWMRHLSFVGGSKIFFSSYQEKQLRFNL